LPLLLVALLYTWARRLRKRGEAPRMPAIAPPPLPAHEAALTALAELEASQLLARGQVKEYHIELSDILRTYVERRFGIEALEMTSHEILLGLQTRGVEPGFVDGLRSFLDPCDLVKFAKPFSDLSEKQQLRLAEVLFEGDWQTPGVSPAKAREVVMSKPAFEQLLKLAPPKLDQAPRIRRPSPSQLGTVDRDPRRKPDMIP